MPRLLKIYMWPIWVLQIFGQSKSFKANPIIGSALLNKMGLHVIRVVLAHTITNFRWFLLRGLMPKDLREQYHRDGFVVIENYLPEKDFNALREDVANCEGLARELTQGDTFTQRILLDEQAMSSAPVLQKFIHNKDYNNYLSYGAAKYHPCLIYLQRIRNGFNGSGIDPQKNLHSDTFHPNMKSWYYLDDVTPDKGPFHFVPGSHALTWKRLKWEYKQSIHAATNKDGYSAKGSLRPEASDLLEMGLPAPVSLTVKANTLLIGNPLGFHNRGQAVEGATRYEIWAYSRHNPFNPFPGLGMSIIGKIERAFMQKYWIYLDGKSDKVGGQSTWHLIDRKAVTDPDYQTPENNK